MARVLITGSNGLLGTNLLQRVLSHGHDVPIGLSRGECQNASLGDFQFIRADLAEPGVAEDAIERARPDVVIHTAAMTNVDGCERQRDEAWATNALAPAYLARTCARHAVRLVHLSTEYVFDGLAGPYGEEAHTNPLGWYARSKHAGEQAALRLHDDCVVARTTIIYGYAAHVRANFVLWLVGQLRAGEQVRIVHDQIGSPTLADNLAEMVLALATSNERGVFNTVGADVVSRLEFSTAIAREFGLDQSLIVPITTAELGQPAPRPLRAGLVMDKFRRAFPNVGVLGVAEGVARLKNELAATGVIRADV
jgi:dTDP-4-dehydrorhamnose reductase